MRWQKNDQWEHWVVGRERQLVVHTIWSPLLAVQMAILNRLVGKSPGKRVGHQQVKVDEPHSYSAGLSALHVQWVL